MLEKGMQAPSFVLLNQDGIEVSLRDILGRKLILYFYPKDHTAGCTLEAKDFTSLLNEIEQAGASVVGISPDSVESHQCFIQKQNLDFMLLSDPQKEVASLYGAFGEKKLYGKTYQGIIRSTFIISSSGEILESFYNVKAKGHVQRVLEVIQNL